MNEGLTEAIEGLVKFTNDYMAKMQAELKVATDKIEAGTFAPNDAFDGMLRAATLWVSGVAGAAVESMDFATTLTKYLGSRTISTPSLKVGAPGHWALVITAPFENAKGDKLEVGCLSVDPAAVQDGTKDEFKVKAVVTQVGGGYYGGTVTAIDKDKNTKDIPVQIQVS